MSKDESDMKRIHHSEKSKFHIIRERLIYASQKFLLPLKHLFVDKIVSRDYKNEK